MAQEEELRLSVTLDDQASAQLERLGRNLGDVAGEGPQGMGRLRRQAGEATPAVDIVLPPILIPARLGLFGGFDAIVRIQDFCVGRDGGEPQHRR
jgi:hypothetical protein